MSKRLDVDTDKRRLRLWFKASVIVPDDPDHISIGATPRTAAWRS